MDKEHIQKLLPEVDRIKDKALRNGVINAWLLAIERGNWDKVDDIPFTLLTKVKKTLIQHTRAVTNMAIAVASTRQDINHDVLIAGALVHDVGKLLEYGRKDNEIVKSEHGQRVRHPISGYGIVLEAGLPLDVAHIVAAHSKEGEGTGRSPEAIVIHHCDFIDFDIEKAK